jgi:L-threonylcarbamoyladenylate synthase
MPLTLRLRSDRPDSPAVVEAAGIIRAGGVVIFPTETVYGIGVGLDHLAATARIFEVKGRPRELPLLVHCAEVQDVTGLVRTIPAPAFGLMQAFLPGPLALILIASERIPAALRGPGDTIGIRVVSHPAARALIRRAGMPLVGSSANRHHADATAEFSAIDPALAAGADVILDAGRCGTGVASTVLNLAVEPPRLLREGAISRPAVEAVLGKKLAGAG